MAVSDTDFNRWLRLNKRREWLLEISYVWPTWRVGTENAYAFAANDWGEIHATARRADSIIAGSLTGATRFLVPTTAQTLGQTLLLWIGGVRLYITADRGFRIYARDAASNVVDQTLPGPLYGLDTLYSIRIEVDRAADEVRVFIDGSQVGASVDISSLGDFDSPEPSSADSRYYAVFCSLFAHVEGVQGFDRLLKQDEISRLHGANPPADINGWAEVIVPGSTEYVNSGNDLQTDAQYVDLLTNRTAVVVVSNYDHQHVFVAAPSSVSGMCTARYSAGGFISGAADTPAHQPYEDRLLSTPTITQINDDLVFGVTRERVRNIILGNSDGQLDFWRWVTTIDQPCTIRLGDPSWPLSDYRSVVGKVLGVGYERNTITFELGGLTSLLEHRANAAEAPICIGNVEGAVPGPNFTWRGEENAGITVANLSVVRDRGAAVAFTDNGDGTFTLGAAQVGQITYETTGWKGGNVPDSDQTMGIDGVLKQFILHHTELTASELDLDNEATLLYPSYIVDDGTGTPGFTGGVYVEPGSNKTAYEVCGELARSALRMLSGASGKLALIKPRQTATLGDIHADRAERQNALVVRRAKNGALPLDYAVNPGPLSDVAADPAGASIWRRRHLHRAIYGDDTDQSGEYQFAPYRDVFSAPWLRSFSAVDGSATNLETRYMTELAQHYAEESGLWRVELQYMPWQFVPGESRRIFAPEFPDAGAVCLIVGRALGGENYLLVINNGH